jgi:micrococcal nuclease
VRFRFLLHLQGVRRPTFPTFRVLARMGQAVAVKTLKHQQPRSTLRTVLALGLLFLAWGAAAPAAADTMHGVVIVVIDGDTVLFRPDHYGAASRAFMKLRLADIDAPEKDQPYGEASTRALAAWVLDQRVEVDTVATDVYGRTIARLRAGMLAVNEEMVRQGYAWASAWSRSNAALTEAQQAARHAQRGLWQDDSPTPPWTWRHERSAPAH